MMGLGEVPMITFRRTVTKEQQHDGLPPWHPLALNLTTQAQPQAHWGWPRKDDQWMLLKADVTKAHRRVKIKAREWKYQVCKVGERMVDQQVKVGTYGMASAQLYCKRAASLLLRLLYKVFPMVDWGFVFVDDFCWLLRKSLAEPLTCAILLFLVAFGCPLSWKKTAIGTSNTWLGFNVTPRLQLVRMGAQSTSW